MPNIDLTFIVEIKVLTGIIIFQVTMLDSIAGLMNAIRMINSYSRYYNTSERMTALLVKVTNQMINACRAHITDSGYYKVVFLSVLVNLSYGMIIVP